MQTAMTQAESATFVRWLRFPPEIEAPFQETYYSRMVPGLRTSIFIFILLSLATIPVSIKSDTVFVFTRLSTVLLLGASATYIAILLASAQRWFATYWQASVVLTTLVYLGSFAVSNDYQVHFYFVAGIILVWSRIQRLQFRWMMLEILGVLVIAALVLTSHSPAVTSQEKSAIGFLLFFFFIPVIGTYRAERFERSEFITKYLLFQERNQERLKREQTENMLHILSQAIGGIVHDLGNPLTAVQGGAQTLLEFTQDDELDRELVQEFAEMINDGAQMLNYLRLSLMEQTRVLENKAVPVTPAPTSLYQMVKAGTHYQKPKFAAGRNVVYGGNDLQVCVDEMRFITIFMNLIGNALKYSDGEVRVTWRAHGAQALIAVQDQGQRGQGISQAQAENLFVPFGRLDTHTEIEGTGLGLLSVRKIAEAHAGEVYIEGFADGTPTSPTFSTAQGAYPVMRDQGFCTAFVTVCPLAFVPQPELSVEMGLA